MRISDWSSDVCSSDLAVLGDFDVARIGRPERGDGGTRYARQEEDLVGQFLVALEKFLVPDRAGFRLHHDDDAVGAEKLVAILLKRLDVFVAEERKSVV